MSHMKPCESQSAAASGPESGNWTLVDEGGEEDEDPESSWLLLCEEDLISLLSQFPFQQLFTHLLEMSKKGVCVCKSLCVCVYLFSYIIRIPMSSNISPECPEK
uniref:Uncharacterized protein n=1 Tax=Hucho hucho TaxID=62062 RepID=A0A4W5M3Y4_9TELE